jgi:hypothetical protein
MPRARKTRAELSQDQVLHQIEDANKRISEMRQEVDEARQGHLSPEYLARTAFGTVPAGTPEEIAAARETQDFIDARVKEINRLDNELTKAWHYFNGLQDTPPGRRSAGSDDEVEAEIAALQGRAKRLGAMRGTFREDAHDALDTILASHRARLTALLTASGPFSDADIEEIIRLWSVRDESLAETLHDMVEQRSEFPAVSRATWRSELDTLNRQIEKRRRELELRSSERTASEAEKAREAAEAQFAAVES